MKTIGPFQVVRHGDITVVVFGPVLRRIDEMGLEDVRGQLIEIVETAVPPWVILDLAATEYFGSSFIEVLLGVWKRLRSRDDARLAVGGLQKYCREVMEITCVDRLLPLFTTRDEAVTALSLPRTNA